jgi:hypothetical protein
LTTALKALGGVVGTLVLSLSALSELIFGIAKAGGVLAAAVVTWTNPWQALTKILDDAAGRQTKLTEAIDTAIGIGDKAADSAAKQAAAMTTSTAATTKAIAANTALSGEQKLLALSTALAADKTLDAGAKIVQYTVAATELIKKQGEQTEAYGKLAKAAKEEGDSMVARAKLTGDNIVIQDASTKAAELHAAALEKVALSGQAEVAMLVAQKAELIASATGRQGGTDAVKVQIAELDKLIVKGSAEVEQSKQASAAAVQQVVERKLLSETLKDNSSKMEIYTAEMVAARVEIESLRAAESRGYDVKVGLANANERLATSTALYRDAVKDSITNTELDTKLKSANLQLSIAQATASGNHYTALAAEARSLGDVAMAQYYEIEAKKESVRILQLKLQLDKLQQESDLLTISIKRKLYEADTEENKIKNKQLDIETQMIKIRQAGNQAILDQIRVIESETNLLRLNGGERDKNGKSLDNDNDKRRKNIEVIDKTTDALKRELEARLAAAGAAATAEYNSLPEQLKRKKADGSLGAGDIDAAKANFEAAKNNLTQIQNAPGGTVGLDGVQDAMRRYNEARDVLDRAGSAGGTAKPAAGSTNTVNINIGGVSTPINVTSAADASNLQSVLKQLAAAQGRSI